MPGAQGSRLPRGRAPAGCVPEGRPEQPLLLRGPVAAVLPGQRVSSPLQLYPRSVYDTGRLLSVTVLVVNDVYWLFPECQTLLELQCHPFEPRSSKHGGAHFTDEKGGAE